MKIWSLNLTIISKKKSIIKFDSKPKYLIINHIVRIINTTRFKIKHIQMSEFIFMLNMHKCCNMNESETFNVFEIIILLKFHTYYIYLITKYNISENKTLKI
jgi:hypothetical protein